MFTNDKNERVMYNVTFIRNEMGRKEINELTLDGKTDISSKLKKTTKNYLLETIEIDLNENSKVKTCSNKYFKNVAKKMGGYNILLLAVDDIEQYGSHIAKSTYKHIRFMTNLERFMKRFNIAVC